MKNDQIKAFCVLCFLLGTIVPWGLLLAGAVVAVVTEGAVAAQISAWLVVSGLALMAASALLSNVIARASRHV